MAEYQSGDTVKVTATCPVNTQRGNSNRRPYVIVRGAGLLYIDETVDGTTVELVAKAKPAWAEVDGTVVRTTKGNVFVRTDGMYASTTWWDGRGVDYDELARLVCSRGDGLTLLYTPTA